MMSKVKWFWYTTLCIGAAFSTSTEQTTEMFPTTSSDRDQTTSSHQTHQTSFSTTSRPTKVCSSERITLNISSDLPAYSYTKINVQCNLPNRNISFSMNSTEHNGQYLIVKRKDDPEFQNNVVPKLFQRMPEFELNMTAYDVIRQSVSFVTITIRVVEVNDPPVIKNPSGRVIEGLQGVFDTRRVIHITVTDPDTGTENGWGNVTVTSPDLPDQLRIEHSDVCKGYCLRVIKPFDADIFTQQQNEREGPQTIMLPDTIPGFELERPGLKGNAPSSNPGLIPGPPIVRFKLVATDGGNLSSTANASIIIEDINDNPPYCLGPGKVYASPIYNIERAPVVDMGQFCRDADNTAFNRIESDGYRLFGHQTCPNVFHMRNARLQHDVRFLEPNVKSCTVSLVVTDRRFATHVTFPVFFGRCKAGYDDKGRYWNETDPATAAIAPCPEDYSGRVYRRCNLNATFEEPVYDCVRKAIANLLTKVMIDREPITDIIKELVNETAGNRTELLVGDIKSVVQILGSVNLRVDTAKVNVTDVVEDYLEIANTLLHEQNTKSWKSLITLDRVGAESVLIGVDSLVEKTVEAKFNQTVEYFKSNMVITVGQSNNCSQDIDFPNRNSGTLPEWARRSRDRISMQCDGSYWSFSTAIYRNISNMMQNNLVENNSLTANSDKLINSPVMSMSVYPKTSVLSSPVTLTFEAFDKELTNPVCAFWNFGPGPGLGTWATDGCQLESYDQHTGIVVCKCDHLTNFAILMSPSTQISAGHQLALSIISVVGCVLSCICLVITVTVHVVFYRVVRSERTTILLNLCVTLFLAYIVFLVGVTRTENKVGCTVISVLLHFLYLTVFLLMLAEGVDLGYRAFSKTTKYPIGRYFTIGAYVGSAVIVAISAAATQFEGYGNKLSCWLSSQSGLIWAFIVPALLVVLVNLVICICVLKQMFGLSAIQQKSPAEKAKAGVRGILVMLPVMGLTWVFGVFSVSESTVVFQYLFAIFNTIQGVLLFIFHCLLNKKIRDSFRSAKSRFLSHDSDVGSTTKSNTKRTDTSQI